MGRVQFQTEFKKTHYSEYLEKIRVLKKYKIRPKKEALILHQVCQILGWTAGRVCNYRRFLILEFTDGVWVYPTDVWNELARRSRGRAKTFLS